MSTKIRNPRTNYAKLIRAIGADGMDAVVMFLADNHDEFVSHIQGFGHSKKESKVIAESAKVNLYRAYTGLIGG